jgi:hypothetical protein
LVPFYSKGAYHLTKNKEKQSAYYKNKYATDEEYRNRILEIGKRYRTENREKCLLAQRKYRMKKHFEKFGYLYRANWEVNIIENPNV